MLVAPLDTFDAPRQSHGSHAMASDDQVQLLYPDFFPRHWWLIAHNQQLYTVSEYARKLSQSKTVIKQATLEGKMVAALRVLWVKHPDFAQAIMNTG